MVVSNDMSLLNLQNMNQFFIFISSLIFVYYCNSRNMLKIFFVVQQTEYFFHPDGQESHK